jgi:hypothetical protein
MAGIARTESQGRHLAHGPDSKGLRRAMASPRPSGAPWRRLRAQNVFLKHAFKNSGMKRACKLGKRMLNSVRVGLGGLRLLTRAWSRFKRSRPHSFTIFCGMNVGLFLKTTHGT